MAPDAVNHVDTMRCFKRKHGGIDVVGYLNASNNFTSKPVATDAGQKITCADPVASWRVAYLCGQADLAWTIPIIPLILVALWIYNRSFIEGLSSVLVIFAAVTLLIALPNVYLPMPVQLASSGEHRILYHSDVKCRYRRRGPTLLSMTTRRPPYGTLAKRTVMPLSALRPVRWSCSVGSPTMQ
jgi:hypothetical protein